MTAAAKCGSADGRNGGRGFCAPRSYAADQQGMAGHRQTPALNWPAIRLYPAGVSALMLFVTGRRFQFDSGKAGGKIQTSGPLDADRLQ